MGLRYSLITAVVIMGFSLWLFTAIDGRPTSSEYSRFIHDDAPVQANEAISVQQGIFSVRPGGLLQTNLTGSGVTLAIFDIGTPRLTHQEFGSRVTFVGSGAVTDNHATSMTGTLAASGQNPESRGFAPASTVNAYQISSGSTDSDQMESAAQNGLRISMHPYSYSAGWRVFDNNPCGATEITWTWVGTNTYSETEDFQFGYYNQRASEWDNISYQNPHYLIVAAAGNQHNAGPDIQPVAHCYYDFNTSKWQIATDQTRDLNGENGSSLSDFALSKNTLVVGNANLVSLGSVSLSGSSGRGPADDGRIKPDLVAPSAIAVTPAGSSDAAYTSSGGTSASTAVVTGVAALILEQFRNLYGRDPLSSTYKALLIHTTDEAGDFEGPDYDHGWGMLNGGRAIRYLESAGRGAAQVRHEEGLLLNGGTDVFTIEHDGVGALRFTMAWTDPAEIPISSGSSDVLNNRTAMLVNDLDMRVSGPGAQSWLPWRLDPDGVGAGASRADNAVDNVEQILIPNADAGTYTISITHKNTLANGEQSYSFFAGPYDVSLRKFTLASAGWRLISSPHPTLPFSSLNETFFTQHGPGGIWATHQAQTTNLWQYTNGYEPVPGEGGEFQPGHGYLFYMYPESPAGSSPIKQYLPATWVAHGSQNQGVNIEITSDNPAEPTYFLAGNPYSESVDWREVYASSDGLTPGLALWNPDQSTGGSDDQSGFVYFSAVLNLGDLDPIIPPNTGFFVNLPENTSEGTLRFRSEHITRDNEPIIYGKEALTPFFEINSGSEKSEMVRMIWHDEALPGIDPLDMLRIAPLEPQKLSMDLIVEKQSLVWDVRPMPDPENTDNTTSDNTYHLRLCGEWSGNQIPLSLTGSIQGYIRINSITSDQDVAPYLDEPVILASDKEILLDLEEPNGGCYTLELHAFPGESSTGTSQPEQSQLPAEVVLHQNFPNPFNPSTVISFDIPEQAHVELTVFTVLGQRVITLQQGYLSAGSHAFQFDAARLSSGVYVINLNVDGRRFSRSMTLLK